MNWKLRNKAFINRQPTLWRHGIPFVELVPLEDDDDETIHLNPLFLEPLNADHDGDTLALYVIHDQKAIEEAFEKAFLGNDIHYDHSDEFLSLVRHEALYSAYILTKDYNYIDRSKIIRINNLSELEENIEYYNRPNMCVIFNDIEYSYGICLFNKWCGYDKIEINYLISKKNNNFLSGKIWELTQDKKLFYHQINHLEKNLLFYISVCNHHSPTINIDEMVKMADQVKDLAAKIPNNIELGYLINEALVERCLEKFGKKETTLYNLFKSGSRFSAKQLSRSCINIGFVADAENKIVPLAFNTNLLKGLTEEEFFESSSGTRKGIRDKSLSTPSSGYLERSLAMGLSIIEIAEDDCGSDSPLEIQIINKKHIDTLINKWYKTSINDLEWKLLKDPNEISISQKIYLRSPICCLTENLKICRKCWGEKQLKTKYIGILAGQILAERFTQLSMRSFHDSGSASLSINKTLLNFIKDHLIDIKSDKEKIILEFDNKLIPLEFSNLESYITTKENSVEFNHSLEAIQNTDPIEDLRKAREIIKATNSPNKTPNQYYQSLMEIILNVGSPYSSFVECLFANMFLTNNDGALWRYNKSDPIIKKLGDKTLAGSISPLLNLLYQQNQRTIENIDFLDQYMKSDDKLTIYEKLFLERF